MVTVGHRTIAVDRCPLRFAREEIELLSFADQARHGAWPVAGGLLDQTWAWVAFCQAAWSEMSAAEWAGKVD